MQELLALLRLLHTSILIFFELHTHSSNRNSCFVKLIQAIAKFVGRLSYLFLLFSQQGHVACHQLQIVRRSHIVSAFLLHEHSTRIRIDSRMSFAENFCNWTLELLLQVSFFEKLHRNFCESLGWPRQKPHNGGATHKRWIHAAIVAKALTDERQAKHYVEIFSYTRQEKLVQGLWSKWYAVLLGRLLHRSSHSAQLVAVVNIRDFAATQKICHVLQELFLHDFCVREEKSHWLRLGSSSFVQLLQILMKRCVFVLLCDLHLKAPVSSDERCQSG
mmetsp:Transcript_31781/g.51024  ORF Transcript_31781/g.51024 Transcript_31781/m.51024 type:complete len:275 (+) Transcript_31781:4213-5037(+)